MAAKYDTRRKALPLLKISRIRETWHRFSQHHTDAAGPKPPQ